MQNAIFEILLNNLPEGVCIFDETGKIIFWNKAAQTILGYKKEETLGQMYHNFIRFSDFTHPHSENFSFVNLNSVSHLKKTEISFRKLIDSNNNPTNVFIRFVPFPGIKPNQSQTAIIFGSSLSGLGLELHNLSNSKSNFSNIIGQSLIMKEIFKKITKIAKSEVPVMIIGESGTGKELLARAIHQISNRNKESFIAIDCHALPLSLLESELFGYEKGAFTGANTSKIGLLELSHKGTIFLDEVIEMDVAVQAKLLRFLQERKFRSLGGRREKEVEVRVISATNKNPHDQISKGTFREDFYYRLGVVEIELPPLRQRKEDIPLLVHSFIKKYSKRSEKKCDGITEAALNFLQDYQWPGNIRQLENVIYRAITMSDKNIISIEDLPEYILGYKPRLFFKNKETKYSNFKKLRKEYIKQFEKEFLIALLERHRGNVTKVAFEAGLSRVTIYRMLELHNIDLQKDVNKIQQ